MNFLEVNIQNLGNPDMPSSVLKILDVNIDRIPEEFKDNGDGNVDKNKLRAIEQGWCSAEN